MLAAIGEGVLSVDDWYPEPVGLRPFTINEAAEVSINCSWLEGRTKRVKVPMAFTYVC